MTMTLVRTRASSKSQYFWPINTNLEHFETELRAGPYIISIVYFTIINQPADKVVMPTSTLVKVKFSSSPKAIVPPSRCIFNGLWSRRLALQFMNKKTCGDIN